MARYDTKKTKKTRNKIEQEKGGLGPRQRACTRVTCPAFWRHRSHVRLSVVVNEPPPYTARRTGALHPRVTSPFPLADQPH